MSHLAERLIREPGTDTAREYVQRVYRLALAYLGLFAGGLAMIALLVLHGRFWVGLAQHSNVETLTLVFLIVFAGYLVALSLPGVRGAARLTYYQALPRLGHDHDAVERRKVAALGVPRDDPPAVALNLLLERDDLPRQPFMLEVADRAGRVGILRVDGAQLIHRSFTAAPTNSSPSSSTRCGCWPRHRGARPSWTSWSGGGWTTSPRRNISAWSVSPATWSATWMRRSYGRS